MAEEQYTLTAADVDDCRKILAEIDELGEKLGGFRVGNVNGARKSATATVHFDQSSDPFTTSAAVTRAVESLPVLGLLCKKIIAHYETNMVHGWGGCAGCGWVHPLTPTGEVRPHDTGGGQCSGTGEVPRREVNHA